MERRTFMAMLTGGIVVAPFAAVAQSAKASRVGLLGLGSAESSPLFEALRQGLRERGWVEGQNIAFEDRTTVGNYSRLPDVAAELVRLKVDIIVTWGQPRPWPPGRRRGRFRSSRQRGVIRLRWDSPLA